MSVLTLRLAGPLQSWGAASRFAARRSTENAPTKSGVIGMLAAACGLERDADLTRLASLRFGVRIDQPGTRIRDFQTAHDWDAKKSMPLSERFYLADAVFVAGIEGERELIAELGQALEAPVFMPYLGRRSCPPDHQKIMLNLHHDISLERALRAEPWQAAPWYQRRHSAEANIELNTLLEPQAGSPESLDDAPRDFLRDQPRSFNPTHRDYGLRAVISGEPISVVNPHARYERRRSRPATAVAHDPVRGLKEV